MVSFFRYILFFIIFSCFIYARCNIYELNNDEKFHILKIANDNFLSVHSESLNIDFLLKCPKNSKIYAKILQYTKANENSFLKIKTSLSVENISLTYSKNRDNINELKFFIDKKQLSTIIANNDIFINKSQNENVDYQRTEKNIEPSLPLGFKCTKEYFLDKFKIKSMSFNHINTKNIITNINKWNIDNKDTDNQKLISWFINCKNWINISKNKNLENLYSIDRQILFQSSSAYKQTENLLSELQQSSINDEEISENIINKFISSMNILKNLEKNKSNYEIFNNIHDVFYIRNDKNLRNSINYILSDNQDSYYYNNLLSNTKMGSFRDTNRFKVEFTPLELNVYSFDNNKDFLVFHIKNSINTNSKNAQFTAYKLSNSFCSSLNSGIKKANKRLKNKITLISYCNTKEFGKAYIYKKQIKSKKQIKKQTIVQNKKENEDKPEIKKSQCKNIDSGRMCIDVSKNKVNNYIKNGFRIPSLGDLLDKFDNEDYEGRTIYGQNDKYFFFDEDKGWMVLDELDEDIPIDLIIIR